MDYLRYYINSLFVILGIVGFLLGGQWVWLGYSNLILIMVADALSPQDYRKRNITDDGLASVVLYLHVVLMIGLYVAFVWRIGQGFGTAPGAATVSAWMGTGLTLILLAILPNAGIAHELLHRKGAIPQMCGRLMFTLLGAPNRDIGHVNGHHLLYDTELDGDTARRGENVYAFAWRCWLTATKDVLEAEKKRLGTRGISLWSWRSKLVQGSAWNIGVLALVAAAGGGSALITMIVVMLVSRAIGEALNYLQHYGILRVPGSPTGSQHTWNHLSAVTRIIGLEITNHIDHHRDPDIPYYKLVPRQEGPQMRNIICWGFAAFVPPLWNKIIQPPLREWDLNQASPEEQILAREANKKAGWPDWFDETTQAAMA